MKCDEEEASQPTLSILLAGRPSPPWEGYPGKKRRSDRAVEALRLLRLRGRDSTWWRVLAAVLDDATARAHRARGLSSPIEVTLQADRLVEAAEEMLRVHRARESRRSAAFRIEHVVNTVAGQRALEFSPVTEIYGDLWDWPHRFPVKYEALTKQFRNLSVCIEGDSERSGCWRSSVLRRGGPATAARE